MNRPSHTASHGPELVVVCRLPGAIGDNASLPPSQPCSNMLAQGAGLGLGLGLGLIEVFVFRVRVRGYTGSVVIKSAVKHECGSEAGMDARVGARVRGHVTKIQYNF